MKHQFNHNFNHVALSVPDIQRAEEFYMKILGLRVIARMTPENMKENDPDGTMNRIYGPELQSTSITIMVGGNSVGFELFQFNDPPYEGPKARPDYSYKDYVKGGFFHICWTVPDPAQTLKLAESLGGKLIGEITSPAKGETALYMQDPWGNIVELLSCGFESLFLSRFTDT